MYQFSEGCNYTHFFRWDKKLIENMNWSILPKSAKAVFPVIACHCNEKGDAFPGEQTISILAGRTEKKVREGIHALETFPGFSWEYYTTRRGKRSKRFHVTFPPEEKGRSFPFFRFILEAGIWRELSPVAQAVYPVMRYFSFFDYDIYTENESIEAGPIEFDEIFKDRVYDFCEAEKFMLAKLAGISRPSLYSALRDLSDKCLIEENGSGWNVYLRSKDSTIFKRSFLNAKIS